MNNFLKHMTLNQLADLVEGRLPPDEQTNLMAHIKNCAQCSSEMAQLNYLIKLMRTDTSEDAPPNLISHTVELFRLKTGIRRHVLAIPRFDSRGLSTAFGVRSGEPGARQLLYNAGPYDIDLRIEADGQAWIISGQVLGEALSYGRVKLQSATETRISALNDQSEFTLPPAKPDFYKLIFYMPNMDIEVNELAVGV